MPMANSKAYAALTTLQWYLDHGVDEILSDTAQDRTKPPPPKLETVSPEEQQPAPMSSSAAPESQENAAQAVMGTAAARVEAEKLAAQCQTLDDLRAAIAAFDGLSVKKTATNMVFSDGHAGARVMLIGEAPGADEDRQGKPFVGVSGQLLDRILKYIGLDRTQDEKETGLYISNILNWRPPGNRTPSPQEIDISLPFIRRHIALAAPDFLILCGGVSAKALLDDDRPVSRLRGQIQHVTIEGRAIPAIATYHPAYLLRTPAQKGKVWQDLLMLKTEIDKV